MEPLPRVPDLLRRHRTSHTAHVRQPVLPVIPAAVRQVDPTHEGHRLVDDDDLLVVCPQIDGGGNVVRVTHHLEHESTILVQTHLTGPAPSPYQECTSYLDVGVQVHEGPLAVA